MSFSFSKSNTQDVLVVEKPSKALLSVVSKLRERKMAQIKELQGKTSFYFPGK